jgi:hypothetical protein
MLIISVLRAKPSTLLALYLAIGVVVTSLCGYQMDASTVLTIPAWPLLLIGHVFENLSNVAISALLTILWIK